MDKNYNFERKKLVLPEYGRHILKMVDHLMTIDNRELRNSQAQIVIEAMGNINPVLRDAADFTHKLWDHLFIISDFHLDVDSPYPLPSRDIFQYKPHKIEYPKGDIRYKHYGRNIENMISMAKEYESEQDRKQIGIYIAKYMRAKSHEFNQEFPNPEVICNDMRKLSDNRIILDENALNSLKNDYKQPHSATKTRRNFVQNDHRSGSNSSRVPQRGGKHLGKHTSSKNQSR